MCDPVTFGVCEPDIRYIERPAAYVVIKEGPAVAVVMPKGRAFLPGGGSLPGESPEATIVRETEEELGRNVRLTTRIGEAVQYFYSADDDAHYKMRATFFAGDFEDDISRISENELHWLTLELAEKACFHACHAWAIRQ
jgi:8-oxo-dGTP pyrophosphatase MutT (NUDIX family)